MTTNQSAQRVLDMLEYLAATGRATLGVMAADLGLNKSTTHRFVSTLVKTGYARQDPVDRSYSLTTRVMDIASQVMQRLQIHRMLHPVLDDLSRVAGETVHLAILDGYEFVYIDKVEGNSAVKMASQIGSRGACHCTALGKVLLAGTPEEHWREYAERRGLPRRTARTITAADALFAELRRVAQLGWAMDDVENEEGIRCIGAPIHDHAGQVVAAISISGWTVSMTEQRAQQLIPLLLDYTRRASEMLGFQSGRVHSA